MVEWTVTIYGCQVCAKCAQQLPAARFLQISTSQQFLRLTFGIAARLVQFG